MSTTRIFLEDVTREAEVRMLEQELPQALGRIKTTASDVVVFGCTSAGALGSSSHDVGIKEMIVRALAEAGHLAMKAAGMGIRANLEIGRVTPAEIVKFVESQICASHPDCIFLSCTNWQAMEAIELLERKLGTPVISSNQAAIDMVRQSGLVISPRRTQL